MAVVHQESRAQEPLNPMIEAYIDMYRPLAIEEMKRTGVPAAIKIAQGILETDAGKSLLVRNSNNHFGIKCKSTWTGEKVYHDDDERGECFRKYASPEDSYRDHSDFLKLQPRYAPLFQIDPMDYRSWAHGLKSAGYATHPSYAQMLIDIIERNDLARYDARGMELMQRHDPSAWTSEKDARAAAVVNSDRLQTVGSIGRNRDLLLGANRVLFVIGKAGDTYEDLAYELDMMPWQFYRYNDVERKKGVAHRVQAGELIYLQPKRNHAATDWHVVKAGETVHTISQFHGIQLDALAKLNHLQPGESPQPGDLLSLRWQLNDEGELPWLARVRGAEMPELPDLPDVGAPQ